MNDDRYDLVVVGAGLAGSSLATQLASAGWHVLLLEQDSLPRHKVCGEFLSPEVQQILQGLQLADAVQSLQPALLDQATITGARGRTITIPLPAPAWGISRYALDATLAQAAAAAGAIVRTGSRVVSYAREDDQNGKQRYTLSVRGADRGQQEIQTRAVVMACGRHTGSGLPPHTPSIRGNKRAVGWRRCVGIKMHYSALAMPSRTELYLVPGGYVGINPIEDGRANLSALFAYDAFAQAGGNVATAIQQLTRAQPPLAERLENALPREESACAVAPVDTERRAAPWAEVACVGDTAAMIPPLCGDGMAMALQAAALCAPLADAYLRGACTVADWQTQYSQRWHREFDRRLRLGRLLQRALSQPGWGDLLLRLGQSAPWLAIWLMQATRGPVEASS